jgi:carbon-monoxide dehydrogenase small subunit
MSIQTCDVRLDVNGVTHELTIEPRETIAEVLRERLGLLGTKVSCELQVCGVCTVLLDDSPVSACNVLAVEADRRRLRTVEGLAEGPDELSALQRAFLEQGAVQCGFCTGGMLVAATALLEENPSPSEEEVRAYLNGNLCRCTGYAAVFRAVADASDEPRERHEMRAGVARRELGAGAMAHHARAHAHGAALDAIDAEQRVGERADGGQDPDHQDPDRGRARVALVDQRMP